MSKQKIIDDIAQAVGICKLFPDCVTCKKQMNTTKCPSMDIARRLYEVGYRKQKGLDYEQREAD